MHLPARTPRATFLCLLSCLWATGCATVLCPAEGGRPWREIRTDHLALYTDLDSTEAREAGLRFERARAAVLQVVPVEPLGRLPIVLTHRDVFEDGRAGVYSTAAGPLISVVSLGIGPFGRASRGEIFAHEFAHYLTETALRSPPHWLGEGLAQLFDQVRVDRDGRTATLGAADHEALEFLRREGTLLSLEALWSWDYGHGTAREEFAHYASSWFWVSFLTRSHGERFSTFLLQVSKGTPAREAWDAVFPPSEDGALHLEANVQMRSWFARWPLRTVEIGADCGARVSERVLSTAEYHVVAARVVAAGLGKTARGVEVGWRQRMEMELEEALRHDPTALVPGLLRLSQAPASRRLELAQQLAATHPDSASARLGLAAQIFAVRGDGEEYRAQLQAAAARVRQDPAFWEALSSVSQRAPELAGRLAALAVAEPVSPELVSSPDFLETLLEPGLRVAQHVILTCLREFPADLPATVEVEVAIGSAGDVQRVTAKSGSAAARGCAEAALQGLQVSVPPPGGLTLKRTMRFGAP